MNRNLSTIISTLVLVCTWFSVNTPALESGEEVLSEISSDIPSLTSYQHLDTVNPSSWNGMSWTYPAIGVFTSFAAFQLWSLHLAWEAAEARRYRPRPQVDSAHLAP